MDLKYAFKFYYFMLLTYLLVYYLSPRWVKVSKVL